VVFDNCVHMKVAYVRSSTDAGSREYQLDAIGSVDRVFEDVISGVKEQRPGLEELLNFVREGDTVVVHSISRLGRSLKIVLQIVEQFNQKGVQLVSVKEGFDASTPVGRMTMNILCSVAELEREQIIDKLQSARRCSKVRQGRKPVIHTKREAIETMLNSGTMSHQQIMKSVGISRGSFYKLIREIETGAVV
jgi:DNA invertase Pin-like site-specific DNA recombinase